MSNVNSAKDHRQSFTDLYETEHIKVKRYLHQWLGNNGDFKWGLKYADRGNKNESLNATKTRTENR